jgi:hypothetical protein
MKGLGVRIFPAAPLHHAAYKLENDRISTILQQTLQQQNTLLPLQKQSPSGGFIHLAAGFILWQIAP